MSIYVYVHLIRFTIAWIRIATVAGLAAPRPTLARLALRRRPGHE